MCGCNGTCGTEEKTPSAKGIVRINYKEDFELVVELLADGKPYRLGNEDFRIDFMVMASRYTEGHKRAVRALQTVEEVEKYDYTTGYPEKLKL